MEFKNIQLVEFNTVLVRYIETIQLEEHEVSAIFNYLFCQANLPKISRRDLKEIIEYFIKVMELKQLATFEAFYEYFQLKHVRMIDSLKIIVNKKKTRSIQVAPKTQVRKHLKENTYSSFDVRKKHIAKANSWLIYNGDLIKRVEAKLRKVSIESRANQIIKHRSSYQKFISGPSNFNNYRSLCKQYFDNFSNHSSGYVEVIPSHTNKFDHSEIIDISANTAIWLFDFEGNNMEWNSNHLYSKIESYYIIILAFCISGEPIQDMNLKKGVGKLMYSFKFSNSIVSIENIQNTELWKDFGNIGTHNKIRHTNFEEHFESIYEKLLSQKQWAILKSPQGHSWITSDNPGVIINAHGPKDVEVEIDTDWKDLQKDSTIYFPLSKDYCLRLYPEDEIIDGKSHTEEKPIKIEESTEKELQLVNCLTYTFTKTVVIASDKKTLRDCQQFIK